MYNNPMYYNNFFPYQNNINNGGILKKGLGLLSLRNINWSNILNNTQKTLNVINQAIPVYYQVKPIYQNAKTMFKMVGALKEEHNDSKVNEIKESNNIKNTNQQGPVFFI